jgi:hypothetical protein
MRTKFRVADYLIELSMSAVVVALYFFGKISIALALLGIALSLSLSWPRRRKKNSSSL